MDVDEEVVTTRPPPTDDPTVTLLIGPAYSGRTEHWRRDLMRKVPTRVSTIRGAERVSLHAACRTMAAGIRRNENCCFDDAALQTAGARRSVLAAARDAGTRSLRYIGLLLAPLGGDEQRAWVREWVRAGGEEYAGETDQGGGDGAVRPVDVDPVAIGEGFDVLRRVVQPLLSPVPLTSAALIIDACAVVPDGDKVHDSAAALLAAWYRMKGPRIVVVSVGDRTDLGCAGNFSRVLGKLNAPYPIYVYCTARVVQPQMGGVDAAPEQLGDLAKAGWRSAGLCLADIAYLQRLFRLNLDEVVLAGARRGRLAQIAKRAGLRWVDASAAEAAVAHGATCADALAKLEESCHDRRAPFLRTDRIKTDTVSSDPLTFYPLLADGAPKSIVAPRPCGPWHQARAATSLVLVSSSRCTAAFATATAAESAVCGMELDAAPAPAAPPTPAPPAPPVAAEPPQTPVPRKESPDPRPLTVVRLPESTILDFFGTDCVQRGAKFHRQRMVSLDSWMPATGTGVFKVHSADKSKQYEVRLHIQSVPSLTLVGAKCECNRDADALTGHNLCRHAAAAAVLASAEGLRGEEVQLKAEPSDADMEPAPKPSPAADTAAVEDTRPPPPLPDLDPFVLSENARLKLCRGRAVDTGSKLPWHMFGRSELKGASPKTSGRRDRGGSPRGRARCRGPGAPRPCQTAYFQFLADVRSEIREEMPGATGAALAKEAGQRWAKLDAVKKETYQSRSREDRDRYEAEMRVYEQTDEYRRLLEGAVAATKRKKSPAKRQRSPEPEPAPKERRPEDDLPQDPAWKLGADGRWVNDWDDSSDASDSPPPPPKPVDASTSTTLDPAGALPAQPARRFTLAPAPKRPRVTVPAVAPPPRRLPVPDVQVLGGTVCPPVEKWEALGDDELPKAAPQAAVPPPLPPPKPSLEFKTELKADSSIGTDIDDLFFQKPAAPAGAPADGRATRPQPAEAQESLGSEVAALFFGDT